MSKCTRNVDGMEGSFQPVSRKLCSCLVNRRQKKRDAGGDYDYSQRIANLTRTGAIRMIMAGQPTPPLMYPPPEIRA